MLRITKHNPGVLDLSAVKDEHGIPVTLNGVSHRDVPDHEEHNPILQRVVDLRWVTLTRLPVTVSVEAETSVDAGPMSMEPLSDSASASIDTSSDSALSSDLRGEAEPTDSTNDPIAVGAETAPELTVADDGPSPSDTVNAGDLSQKSDASTRPAGKSDARKAGRRS